MKIAIAQVIPVKGNIELNVKKHLELITLASVCKADAIFFPELSLTGYEPRLAKQLATDQEDLRLESFQRLCDESNIAIGLGLPTKTNTGVQISIIIFQPCMPKQTYSKQQLHADELPYFQNGNEQIILTVGDCKIAPAICYESLQPEHVEKAVRMGAGIYMACVAKSRKGTDKAMAYYPLIAKNYHIIVLMANCSGFCDDFESAGKSSVWTGEGNLAGQLNMEEGLLVFDTETEEAFQKSF